MSDATYAILVSWPQLASRSYRRERINLTPPMKPMNRETNIVIRVGSTPIYKLLFKERIRLTCLLFPILNITSVFCQVLTNECQNYAIMSSLIQICVTKYLLVGV